VNERIIVDDIVDYYRDLIRLGEDSAAMKNPAHTALGRFSNILTRQINAIYKKNPLTPLPPELVARCHLPGICLRQGQS